MHHVTLWLVHPTYHGQPTIQIVNHLADQGGCTCMTLINTGISKGVDEAMQLD
jgi:hypothetical protein